MSDSTTALPPASPRASIRQLVIVRASVGAVLVLLAIGLGAWIYSRGDVPFTVDTTWMAFLAGVRGDVLIAFSFAMNWLGGGLFGVYIFPIAVAVVLIIVRRPWAALFFISAEVLSAGFVQVLKQTFGRARPEDIIVVSDFGSYPSGHVANAATLAVVAFVLWPRLWVAVVGVVWAVLMAFSRTYLGAHWLSDTAGGALAGVGVALLVAAAFAVLLEREARRHAVRVSARRPSLG